MKQVLGLLLGFLGTLAVTISAAVELSPGAKEVSARTPTAGEGSVAPLCVLPASHAQKGSGTRSTLAIKPPPPWLAELNQWRRMAGLPVVIENPHLSSGSEEHARYLVLQGPLDVGEFRAYDRRIGPGAHLEDPHRSSYTAT